MKIFCIILLLVSLTIDLGTARVSKRPVKILYQPYGSLMCKHVCGDSTNSYIYTKEDLSCRQISRNISNNVKQHSAKDSFICLKDHRTGTGYKVRHHECDQFGKGQNELEHLALLTGNVESNYTKLLHKACQEGDLCLLKYFVSKKLFDINNRNVKRRSLVMTAALSGQTEVFHFLVKFGCDLRVRDYKHNSVLHLACAGGNIDIVRELIVTHSLDVDSQSRQRWTPVMYAACYGHTEIIDLLLREGCDPSLLTENNNNMLHVACIYGNINIVKYILKHDILSTESRGETGRTPVLFAAYMGYISVVDVLIQNNCNGRVTDDEKKNLLHLACLVGNVSVVKHILELGIVGIESREFNGRTPVMLAAKGGHRDVFELLVSRNCNVLVTDNDNNNIMHMSCAGGNLDIVTYVFKLGIIEKDSRGDHSRTPLMTAVSQGHQSVVDLLLSKNCNVTATDDDGNNILFTAVTLGVVKMVRYIIGHNLVDIDCPGFKGRTAVMEAAHYGHMEIVEFLISKNCDVAATDDDKNNILHVACIGGEISLLRYILQLDVVDIDSRGQNNITPVMYAVVCGHGAAFDLLVSKNCNLMLKDTFGNNVLHVACYNGRAEMVDMILRRNLLGVNSRGQYDMTPLMLAVVKHHSKVAALLLKRNCDLEAVDIYGNNILHVACKSGHLVMVKYILKLGVMKLDIKNKAGRTPENIAMKKGHKVIASLLREKKY